MSKKRHIDQIIDVDEEEDELEIAIKMSMEKLYNEDMPIEERKPAKNIEISWSKAPFGESFFMNTIKDSKLECNNNTISFSDILRIKNPKGHEEILQAGLFSTYLIDIRWFMKQVRKDVPVTIIKHWDKRSEKEGHFIVNDRFTFVHPPLLEYGNVHSKFCLLLFSNFIRVVISSANLTEEDWSQVNNCVWYQDFPKKPKNYPKHSESNQFATTLKDFIKKMNLDSSFLDEFDFSSAKVFLVSSISGYHKKEELNKYGHLSLRNLLSTHFSYPSDGLIDDIYFQASSIGSIESWIPEFIKSCEITDSEDSTKSNFHIIYPTKSTANKSSMSGKGMLCFSQKYWNSNYFPRDLFCDTINSNPAREGLQFHSKILFRNICSDSNQYGWCYAGSHNLSPSAWGRLQKNGTQLHIANYELGVLFIDSVENRFAWSQNIPFQVPPPPYSKRDEPFFS